MGVEIALAIVDRRPSGMLLHGLSTKGVSDLDTPRNAAATALRQPLGFFVRRNPCPITASERYEIFPLHVVSLPH